MSSNNGGGPIAATCCIVISIILFFLMILLPLKFVKLEYHQLGLKQDRIGGTVYRDTTYIGGDGRKNIGVNGIFVVYPSTVQNMYLPDQNVWSLATDEDAGTLLDIDVSFQYQLIPERLGDLYEKVSLEYEAFITNLAITAIKNEATLYSADDYLARRKEIENALLRAVRTSLYRDADTEVF